MRIVSPIGFDTQRCGNAPLLGLFCLSFFVFSVASAATAAQAPNATVPKPATTVPSAKVSAPKAPAAPSSAQKLLNDIDRRALTLYAAADEEHDQEISPAELQHLMIDAEKAAAKLASARKPSDAQFQKLTDLIDAPADRQPGESAASQPPQGEAQTKFVKDFRDLVVAAIKENRSQLEAKQDAALAKKQAEEEAVVDQPPPARVRSTGRDHDYYDDQEKRRLKDQAHDAEYRADQLQRQLDYQRGYGAGRATSSQPRPSSSAAAKDDKPSHAPQTLRDKIGYPKDKDKDKDKPKRK